MARKRKVHLIYYSGSTYANCGATLLMKDDATLERPYFQRAINGVEIGTLPRPCRITCKTCRNSWMFRDLLRRREQRAAT